jgi:hypothetical protein
VSSLITVGLFGVALYQFGALRRDREAEQAKLVSAWISATPVGYKGNNENPTMTVEVSLRNVSTQPIGRVHLEVNLGAQRRQQDVGPVAPDGSIRKVSVPFVAIPLSDAQKVPTLDIWFTDEAGHQWHRPHGGQLKQGALPKDWNALRLTIGGRPQPNESTQSKKDPEKCPSSFACH